jgi:hypothetical protein
MSRTTVVYLSGFGRSGSTLVERLLGAAPGWVNVGELVDLARSVAPADERCGCGSPFSRCPVWTEVGRVAFGGWTPEILDRLALLQRSAARQRHLPGLLVSTRPPSVELVELRDAYARIYRAVAEVSGANVVVDASKGPALGAAVAGAADVDLSMLNLVRDPRAVAWSWRRHVDRPHATSGADEMWRIPVHRSAAQWTALQLEVEAIARAGRTRVARVRYEDVVTDPIRTLVAATTALGVPLGPGDLPVLDGGDVVLQPSHGLSGNPGRFRSGLLALLSDDGWTSEMPPSSRALVTAITLPLLATYRYPLSTRRAAPAVPFGESPSWSSP